MQSSSSWYFGNHLLLFDKFFNCLRYTVFQKFYSTIFELTGSPFSNQFEVEEDLYFCHLATNRFISGENPQAENNSNGTDAYWRKIIIGGKNGITRGARLPISHLVQIVTVLQFKLSSMPAFGIDFLTHVQNFAISWQLWWGSIVFEHDTTFFCGAYIANWLSRC